MSDKAARWMTLRDAMGRSGMHRLSGVRRSRVQVTGARSAEDQIRRTIVGETLDCEGPNRRSQFR